MFDLPGVVDAEPVGELDLVEALVEQLVLGVDRPGPWQLVLVEDPELHAPTVDDACGAPISGARSIAPGERVNFLRTYTAKSSRVRLAGWSACGSGLGAEPRCRELG